MSSTVLPPSNKNFYRKNYITKRKNCQHFPLFLLGRRRKRKETAERQVLIRILSKSKRKCQLRVAEQEKSNMDTKQKRDNREGCLSFGGGVCLTKVEPTIYLLFANQLSLNQISHFGNKMYFIHIYSTFL